MEREGGASGTVGYRRESVFVRGTTWPRAGAQPLVSSPVREKTQREKTHVSALPFSLPLALTHWLLALLVLHRLVDGQDHASRFGSAGDRVLFTIIGSHTKLS